MIGNLAVCLRRTQARRYHFSDGLRSTIAAVIRPRRAAGLRLADLMLLVNVHLAGALLTRLAAKRRIPRIDLIVILIVLLAWHGYSPLLGEKVAAVYPMLCRGEGQKSEALLRAALPWNLTRARDDARRDGDAHAHEHDDDAHGARDAYALRGQRDEQRAYEQALQASCRACG